MPDATRVTVLGTGIMGGAMSGCLLRAGMNVTVWDRTATRTQALAGQGASVAGSPSEAVSGADFVVTMLADGAAVEEVMVSPGDGLAAMKADSVFVQMGTIGVAATERLADRAKRHQVIYVDAPVSGTREPAERGELLILASGPEEVRDRCAAVFDVLGSRTMWLGGVGAGTRTKLALNHWLCTVIAGLADTLALAEALGLDVGTTAELLGGRMAPPFALPKLEQMVADEYPLAFPLRYAHKDLALLIEAAGQAGGRVDLATEVASRYASAMDLGLGDEDYAAVYRALGR